jgi:hypothetical protein
MRSSPADCRQTCPVPLQSPTSVRKAPRTSAATRPCRSWTKQDRVREFPGVATPDLRVLYIENREMGTVSWFTKAVRETALLDMSISIIYSYYVCSLLLTRFPTNSTSSERSSRFRRDSGKSRRRCWVGNPSSPEGECEGWDLHIFAGLRWDARWFALGWGLKSIYRGLLV